MSPYSMLANNKLASSLKKSGTFDLIVLKPVAV